MLDFIRIATARDLPDIINLVNQTYRPQDPDASWTNEARIVSGERLNMNQARQLIQDHRFTLLAGFIQQQLTACVLIEKQENTAKIGLLTVAIQMQQRGLGKQMLAAAESYAANTLHSDSISMNVLLIRSELINFYCRQGYSRTGLIYPYPQNLDVGTPKIANLEFEVLTKSLQPDATDNKSS